MAEPTRYPLAWPAGRPRCKSRKPGVFKSYGKPVGISVAISRLTEEIDRLGGRYPLLSTNYEVRMDGSLILNRGTPGDPGVCVYFQLKGEPMTMACDRYTEAAQNIAALAAHIEATRRIERHGVATAAETLMAFRALPPPAAPVEPEVNWRAAFNLPKAAFPEMSGEELMDLVEVRYKRLIRGASEAALKVLNVARDKARDELLPKRLTA